MIVVAVAAMAPDRAVVMVAMSAVVNDPFAMLPTIPVDACRMSTPTSGPLLMYDYI